MVLFRHPGAAAVGLRRLDNACWAAMEKEPHAMRVLFIGGTGFISTAASRMAISRGFELYLLNR